MVFTVTGKGDLKLLSKFNQGDFDNYELYLGVFNQAEISQELVNLPEHIKIVSVHNPTAVLVNGTKHEFDLSHPGEIGKESFRVLKETVELTKQLGAKIYVIHGAKYGAGQTQDEAFNLLVNRVNEIDTSGLTISFENDALGINTFSPRCCLLSSIEDFEVLERKLGNISITLDVEHIFITSLFNLIRSNFDVLNNSKDAYYQFYFPFVKNNPQLIGEQFKLSLASFFDKFKERINHLHLNGSDYTQYFLDPETVLPLIGEHLPLNYISGEVSDKIDYLFLTEQFKKLPKEKQINIVLELGIRESKYDFCSEICKSKLFLEKHIDLQFTEKEEIKMTEIFEKLSGKEGPFIIADVGCNHGGSMEEAKRLIDKAKEAGCDAVKFQSFTKESLVSKNIYDSRKDVEFEDFGVKGLDKLHEKILFGDNEYRELKRYCDEIGIMFSSSAFAEKEADLLAELNVPFIKIASMELNNLNLLEYVAKKNIPIIISTGMGSMKEIETAIETIQNAGNNKILILHCIAMYPVKDYNIINLNKMQMLKEKFNLPVGFSDHTLDASVPIAATALGACVVEKHFIINRDDPFARERDFAMDFEAMKRLVQDCKRAYLALGNKYAEVSEEELEMTKILRRSAVVRRDMNAGEIINKEDVAFKRPGTGIPPTELNTIIGKKLNRDKAANELVLREDLMGI